MQSVELEKTGEKCPTTGQMFGSGLVKPEAPTGHPHEDGLQGMAVRRGAIDRQVTARAADKTATVDNNSRAKSQVPCLSEVRRLSRLQGRHVSADDAWVNPERRQQATKTVLMSQGK